MYETAVPNAEVSLQKPGVIISVAKAESQCKRRVVTEASSVTPSSPKTEGLGMIVDHPTHEANRSTWRS